LFWISGIVGGGGIIVDCSFRIAGSRGGGWISIGGAGGAPSTVRVGKFIGGKGGGSNYVRIGAGGILLSIYSNCSVSC